MVKDYAYNSNKRIMHDLNDPNDHYKNSSQVDKIIHYDYLDENTRGMSGNSVTQKVGEASNFCMNRTTGFNSRTITPHKRLMAVSNTSRFNLASKDIDFKKQIFDLEPNVRGIFPSLQNERSNPEVHNYSNMHHSSDKKYDSKQYFYTPNFTKNLDSNNNVNSNIHKRQNLRRDAQPSFRNRTNVSPYHVKRESRSDSFHPHKDSSFNINGYRTSDKNSHKVKTEMNYPKIDPYRSNLDKRNRSLYIAKNPENIFADDVINNNRYRAHNLSENFKEKNRENFMQATTDKKFDMQSMTDRKYDKDRYIPNKNNYVRNSTNSPWMGNNISQDTQKYIESAAYNDAIHRRQKIANLMDRNKKLIELTQTNDA